MSETQQQPWSLGRPTAALLRPSGTSCPNLLANPHGGLPATPAHHRSYVKVEATDDSYGACRMVRRLAAGVGVSWGVLGEE